MWDTHTYIHTHFAKELQVVQHKTLPAHLSDVQGMPHSVCVRHVAPLDVFVVVRNWIGNKRKHLHTCMCATYEATCNRLQHCITMLLEQLFATAQFGNNCNVFIKICLWLHPCHCHYLCLGPCHRHCPYHASCTIAIHSYLPDFARSGRSSPHILLCHMEI